MQTSTPKQSPKLKMCGLFRDEDIRYANMLKPDFIGFVFAPSLRRISKEQALSLKSKLDSTIKAVGVFVNESDEVICDIYKSGAIDIIQLHNEPNAHRIANLKSHTNATIIQAINVQDSKDILDGAKKATQADFLLLDNKRGGSGECFEWQYIQEARDKGFAREFFLAGGLNISNIAQALALQPYGVDLSKGLETNGVKDFAKMQAIYNAVKGVL